MKRLKGKAEKFAMMVLRLKGKLIVMVAGRILVPCKQVHELPRRGAKQQDDSQPGGQNNMDDSLSQAMYRFPGMAAKLNFCPLPDIIIY